MVVRDRLPTLLSQHAVCYKPSMRKWMRDRMKRRQKPAASEQADSPTPLQPAYFNTEPPPPAPSKQGQEGEPEAQTAVGQDEAESQSQPPGSTPARRRRRRGGRGRNRSAPRSSSRASAAAEVEAVAPEPSPAQPTIATTPEISAPLVQPPATPTARAPKGTVVLAIGLPGSGKSSWFKRHNITPLSSDLLRALLFDDPTEQRYQDLIFSNLRSMLRARLIARRPMNYVDATNLTPHERQGWIKLAKDYGYEVQAVFFNVPLEVCLERNAKRHRVVAEDVMRRMASKLKPPTFDEGFSKVTVVRVKQK